MKKDIRKQVQKANPEFYDEVVNLGKEQLDARITQMVKDDAEVDAAKEEDEALQSARDLAKYAAAPYLDAKKAIKLKIKLLLTLLEGK